MAKHRALMVGAGGMAGRWARAFVPLHAERVEIVALVDVKEEVLNATGDAIGVAPARRFTSMEAAFGAVDDADCCFVAVPPQFHEPAIVAAARRGLAVLSETPLADAGAACARSCRWGSRAGCEHEAVTVRRDRVVRVQRFRRGGGLSTQEIPLVKPASPGHSAVVDQGHGAVIGQFLDWLDGGPQPETVLADNIKSIAIVH